MSNKLQNTKAIQEMMSGTHKSQTRKSYGFNKTVTEKHVVGDTWTETDTKGTAWRITQHDGYRTRQVENSIIEQVRKALTVPDTCPCCNKTMRDEEQQLNFKMYFIHKKCFECVITEESRIRSQGKEAWDAYNKERMMQNAEAWFKDTDKEVALLREAVRLQFIQNADGRLEDWDQTAFLEKFDTDYKQLKENVYNNLKG
jgi:hypothetical protein